MTLDRVVVSLLALAACTSPRTQVVARIDTDMTQGPTEVLTGIAVRVTAMDEPTPRFERRFDLAVGAEPLSLPADLGLVPADPSANRRVTVEVDALHGETRLFTRRAIVTFAQGHTLRADIFLADRCRLPDNQDCPFGATCGLTGCEREEQPLPDLDAGVRCNGVDCSTLTDTCNVGTCDATGACVASPIADGTGCDDADPCTDADVCRSGVCAGTEVGDGTSCDDMHACTSPDACTRGACIGALSCPEPSGIVASGLTTDTAVRGSASGGTLFEDACGPSEVLVGIGGLISATGYLGQMSAICATISLSGSGLGPYTITTGARTTGPVRGLLGGGAAYSATCPGDQVVVGFGGRAGLLVDQVALRCARVSLGETASELVPILGPATAIAPVGGAGGEPFADTSCPAGSVAVEARIRAGDGIDAFGLGCKPLVLP